MYLKLRNKRQVLSIAVLTLILLALTGGYLVSRGDWSVYDYKLLDHFYRFAIHSDRGPSVSNRIVYLVATDETYQFFGKNYLDRADMARVNSALAKFSPAAVAFDIIFAHPGHPESDLELQTSLAEFSQAYLPIGVNTAIHSESIMSSAEISTYMENSSDILQPTETGQGKPYMAKRFFLQNKLFSTIHTGVSHISALSDPDGTYRHQALLIKVKEGFLPSLGLSMFLDYSSSPVNNIRVHWGDTITIPASETGREGKHLSIPIDLSGRVFVPYPGKWGYDFPGITMHGFLEAFSDESLRGNLLEFFEGKFVFVGDVSTGVTDMGHTTLEPDTPLISQHAAMLNAMLTDCFYTQWTDLHTVAMVLLIGLILGISGSFQASWIFYVAGSITLPGLTLLTWVELTQYKLLPLASAGTASIVIFIGLIIGIEVITGKERRFIKTAFSHYVPEKVVNDLLINPGILKLGGEKKEMTVLFSDIEGFTTISEKMPNKDLVHLLNQYLTAMTDIVLGHGGVIDKYEGDAIMAEFGAPIMLPDHADHAVSAAIDMQQRLKEMRPVWASQGLPELSCRIGINTGDMVVGNMGSDQVFDYTVIGDAVNLASRLEEANKLYNTNIMISEFTLKKLTPGKFGVRELDRIRVKGKTEEVTVFEVLLDKEH